MGDIEQSKSRDIVQEGKQEAGDKARTREIRRISFDPEDDGRDTRQTDQVKTAFQKETRHNAFDPEEDNERTEPTDQLEAVSQEKRNNRTFDPELDENNPEIITNAQNEKSSDDKQQERWSTEAEIASRQNIADLPYEGKLESNTIEQWEIKPYQEVPIAEIHYSQKDVSPRTRDGRTIEEVAHDIRTNGWDYTKEPPDMIDWGDGIVTTLDHRRILATQEAGLKEIPAKIHSSDEPLPEDLKGRFKFRESFTDDSSGKYYEKGKLPETWGEALMGRSAFNELPLQGSPTPPRIKER